MTEGELATINPNDLGNNPDEWMNKLQEKIQRWEERIKEDQKHLAALTTLYERMDRYPFAKFLEEAKREVTTIEGSL
jgi:dissimilatory sulfite reductase (desulfoviridin) alpha/beta subunit